MTNTRVFARDLIVVPLILFVLLSHANGQKHDNNLSKWISNAIQWESVWGTDEVTCAGKSFSLSRQLALSKDHTFSFEMVRNQDGAEVILPELHRVVSIRLTADEQLAALTTDTTCDGTLEVYGSKLQKLKRSEPPTDARLRAHLDDLNRHAHSPVSRESSTESGTLHVASPQPRNPRARRAWSKAKVAALSSIEAAANKAFNKMCTPGEAATARIPDFQLYDPKVMVLVEASGQRCVLPVAFEYRASSLDPFIAYETYNCIEEGSMVRKTERLMKTSQVATSRLVCRTSQD